MYLRSVAALSQYASLRLEAVGGNSKIGHAKFDSTGAKCEYAERAPSVFIVIAHFLFFVSATRFAM